MDEYIKRSEVIDLVEKAIKKCSTEKTTKGVLVCAHLRTAVMGLRSADVAPRAEIAKEIFEEIRDLIRFTMEPYSTILYAKIEFEKLEDLRKKYRDPDPQKGDHHE